MSEEKDPRIEGLAQRVREREEEALAELLRPLDKAEKGALADGVFAALDAEARGEKQGKQGEEAGKQEGEQETRAPVVPIAKAKRAESRRRFGFVGVLLAAALGAAAIFVGIRRSEAPTIAAYTLSVEGGNKIERGDEPRADAVIRLDPASRLSLALRPAGPVSGAIAVRAFLVREGSARAWDAPAALGAGGVVRIEGTAAALFGDVPEGAWDVVIMLGRPEALPEDATLTRAAASGEGLAGLSIHRVRITLSKPRGALGGGAEGPKRVLFSGCSAVHLGGECELGEDRTLRFFLPTQRLPS